MHHTGHINLLLTHKGGSGKFSPKWKSTQMSETLNARLGIVFNSAR